MAISRILSSAEADANRHRARGLSAAAAKTRGTTGVIRTAKAIRETAKARLQQRAA